jgi:hypothetical protein
MASRTIVAARTTALLTGSATVDYADDLDMDETLDGWVTVEVIGTKGSLTNIVLGFHAGNGATPTQPISNGNAVMSETIADASWTRVISWKVNCRYFRVSVTGTGADPTGSDAVISYYYQPNVMTGALVDGSIAITA